MKNLAGNQEADDQIEMELDGAGIPIEPALVHRSEVPYTIIGKLGDFTFYRAWYYWVVEGNLPVEAAHKLYADPIGRKDVRVAGHCGCPPPEAPWVKWFMPDGREVAPKDQEAEYRDFESRHPLTVKADDFVWSDDPEGIGAKCFVTSYHIDSYKGLKLFAKALRDHGLVPVEV